MIDDEAASGAVQDDHHAGCNPINLSSIRLAV